MVKELPDKELRRVRKGMMWAAAIAGTFFAGLLIASFIETIGLMPPSTTNSGGSATAGAVTPADSKQSR